MKKIIFFLGIGRPIPVHTGNRAIGDLVTDEKPPVEYNNIIGKRYGRKAYIVKGDQKNERYHHYKGQF